MIEVLCLPGALAVAKEACGGIAGAGMFSLIVRLVAGHAVLVIDRLETKTAALYVAGTALDILVSPPELITAGKLSVVESSDVQPGLGCVAGEALTREFQGDVVHLFRGLEVLLVACETVCR